MDGGVINFEAGLVVCIIIGAPLHRVDPAFGSSDFFYFFLDFDYTSYRFGKVKQI
jgi:hypothetical protein